MNSLTSWSGITLQFITMATPTALRLSACELCILNLWYCSSNSFQFLFDRWASWIASISIQLFFIIWLIPCHLLGGRIGLELLWPLISNDAIFIAALVFQWSIFLDFLFLIAEFSNTFFWWHCLSL